jgi:D-alanyl-D-alanine carboxypeptidase
MTGAVLLTLVDEGILRLDDPIGRWLDEHPHIDGEITIRQLLNHTNGLANYTDSSELFQAAIGNHSRVFEAGELLAYVEPPVAAPGERTQYTNTAFLLLGLIAERATGRSLVDLYRQRLWAPLELTEIFLPGLEEASLPMAWSRGIDRFVDPLTRLSLLSLGSYAMGLVATARTVASWGRALFCGSVISDDRQREMRQLVPAAGNIPGESGAGLGIRGYTFLDRRQYGHSGGSRFGSSLLIVDLETGITVAVLMNQAVNAHHFDLAPRLLSIAASMPVTPQHHAGVQAGTRTRAFTRAALLAPWSDGVPDAIVPVCNRLGDPGSHVGR